jgi:hypothetical protein
MEDVATDGLIVSGGAVTTTGATGCLIGAGDDPGHASRDTTATSMIAAGIQTAAGIFRTRRASPRGPSGLRPVLIRSRSAKTSDISA